MSVCSRSSEPPPTPAPRMRPTASISSMKITHGEFSFAVLNRSRTRLAPTPTNIWMNSLPLMEKNGTFASPATALASSVLPVPGGPTSSTPLGTWAPSRVNLLGSLRKSTTLLEFAFGGVHAGHVVERAAALPLFVAAGGTADVTIQETAAARFANPRHDEENEEQREDKQGDDDEPKQWAEERHLILIAADLHGLGIFGPGLVVIGLDAIDQRQLIGRRREIDLEFALIQMLSLGEFAVRVADFPFGAVRAEEHELLDLPRLGELLELAEGDEFVAPVKKNERDQAERNENDDRPPGRSDGRVALGCGGGRCRGGALGAGRHADPRGG